MEPSACYVDVSGHKRSCAVGPTPRQMSEAARRPPQNVLEREREAGVPRRPGESDCPLATSGHSAKRAPTLRASRANPTAVHFHKSIRAQGQSGAPSSPHTHPQPEIHPAEFQIRAGSPETRHRRHTPPGHGARKDGRLSFAAQERREAAFSRKLAPRQIFGEFRPRIGGSSDASSQTGLVVIGFLTSPIQSANQRR